MAKQIYRYLSRTTTPTTTTRSPTPITRPRRTGRWRRCRAELAPHAEQVFQLIDSVFSDAQLPEIDDDRKAKTNPLNANFEKKEFQELWSRINRKAAYTRRSSTPPN